MNQQLSPIENFQHSFENERNINRLQKMLGNEVPVDTFTSVVIRAVQEKPDLLSADRKSLFLACQSAAQEGLMPDGREGALVVRSVKHKGAGPGGQDKWVNEVKWQAMIGGIRKRLAAHNFDLRAEIVREMDFEDKGFGGHFDYELGDTPWLKHKPARLGTVRGAIVGAYAIAENLKTGKQYIEVMDIPQLEQIREVAKTDYVWKEWLDEMYRKTVARRILKQLPIAKSDTRIAAMIDNDNDHFSFIPEAEPSTAAQDIQAALTPQPEEPEQITEQPGFSAQGHTGAAREVIPSVAERVEDESHIMTGEPPEFPADTEHEFKGREPGF